MFELRMEYEVTHKLWKDAFELAELTDSDDDWQRVDDLDKKIRWLMEVIRRRVKERG